PVERRHGWCSRDEWCADRAPNARSPARRCRKGRSAFHPGRWATTGGNHAATCRYWCRDTARGGTSTGRTRMQWWDSYRAVYGTELRAEAMVLADHGWAVVPGTFPQGEVWTGRTDAPQAGPTPVLDDWAAK